MVGGGTKASVCATGTMTCGSSSIQGRVFGLGGKIGCGVVTHSTAWLGLLAGSQGTARAAADNFRNVRRVVSLLFCLLDSASSVFRLRVRIW
ncbi:hypothetical protein D3C85_1621570 [compost metagenome]